MSSFLLLAIAVVVPFVLPVPASLSSLMGPAYMVLFGAALLKAGHALRPDREKPAPNHDKDSWAGRVPQSTVTPI